MKSPAIALAFLFALALLLGCREAGKGKEGGRDAGRADCADGQIAGEGCDGKSFDLENSLAYHRSILDMDSARVLFAGIVESCSPPPDADSCSRFHRMCDLCRMVSGSERLDSVYVCTGDSATMRHSAKRTLLVGTYSPAPSANFVNLVGCGGEAFEIANPAQRRCVASVRGGIDAWIEAAKCVERNAAKE